MGNWLGTTQTISGVVIGEGSTVIQTNSAATMSTHLGNNYGIAFLGSTTLTG
jgi:hypothetical protein